MNAFRPLLASLVAALLSACGPIAAATVAERLDLVPDDLTIRVELMQAPARGYALAVIPAGTDSISLRLQNGPAQTPALLTADRVVTFDTSSAVGPKEFTRLRPGQYRLIARAYSEAAGGGALLGERVLDQTYVGGGTTSVTLKLRITALAGEVGL